jgi:hypothetical protein
MTYCPKCGAVITESDFYRGHIQEEFAHCDRIFYIESANLKNYKRVMRNRLI